jgi:hypothetical protein
MEVGVCLVLLITVDIGWREERWCVLSLTTETAPTNLLLKTVGIGV